MTLTLDIENIEFDTQACKLRVKGRNIEENEHVKMGAYHTIDIEGKKFLASRIRSKIVSTVGREIEKGPEKNKKKCN